MTTSQHLDFEQGSRGAEVRRSRGAEERGDRGEFSFAPLHLRTSAQKAPLHPGTSAPLHILITGGCGYIGSQLIRDLAEDPALASVTVRILDNMQRGGYQALMDLPEQGCYEFLEGDILDPAAVRRALEGVDAVVHLAAVVRTPLSFDHPAWTEQVNHWGTARLVEQCLEAGVSRFVFASSASVYGPGGPFDETSVCRPVGPYAQSKWRAERAVLTAADRGLQPTVLRLATIFGYAPMMRFDAVANRFAYLAGVGRPLTVYGTGEQTRPLIHVRDASAAIRFCLAHEAETVGEVFNAVGENVSVLDLVEAVREVKPDVRVHYTEQDVLTHFSFAVDGRKLERLGWEPRYSIEAGMAEVVARFRGIGAVPVKVLERGRGGTRRGGDKETRRGGDKETRRGGDGPGD